MEAQPVLATTDVFRLGCISCTSVKVDSSAPKPLLIITPVQAGPAPYPVIFFCHGFVTPNRSYSQLLHHIATHGYIVVAPQFCSGPEWVPMSTDGEVECAGQVADWLADNLKPLLPENVVPDLEKFVMAGHSRGGKTAFAAALGYAQTKLNIKALVGVDPVAGRSPNSRSPPKILKYEAGSFKLSGMPVAIIGTGLGSQRAYGFLPPCAPEGVNHMNIFCESNPPCAYFVAKEYGHTDMLDDHPGGVCGKLIPCSCKKNKDGDKDCMRRTVGGLVVAFLRAHLDLQTHDLDTIVDNPALSPAKLYPAIYIKAR